MFVPVCFVLFCFGYFCLWFRWEEWRGKGGGKNGYEKMSRTYCFIFNFFQTNIFGLLYEGFAICNPIVWF